MALLRTHPRPGSRADRPAQTAPGWEREWHEADSIEREERSAARRRRRVAALVGAALLAALADAILPLTPGFSPGDTTAAVGAAAIHLAVAKDHFDQYTLFGLFFAGSGIAQLAWAVWVLLRPTWWLLALGAVGNTLIVALWAVDRVWGLPIGPDHLKPEPVGFGDGATSGFELVVVAGCLAQLARVRGRSLGLRAAVALAVAAALVTALGLLSALGVGSSVPTPTA